MPLHRHIGLRVAGRADAGATAEHHPGSKSLPAGQSPTDVAPKVLAQLGNRVQHALRAFTPQGAFTPQDADNLRKAARTFPITKDYDVEQTLQALAIGEAFVTVLTPRGVPTPLAWTVLIPPDSLMAAVEPAAVQELIAASPLTAKYAQAVDRESAHEMIRKAQTQAPGQAPPGAKPPKGGRRRAQKPQKGGVEVGDLVKQGTKFATSRQGQAVIRNVLGTLFGKR